MNLRPYQNECVSLCVKHLSKDSVQHAIAVLPTGSGKSIVIAEIAKRINGTVLVLQPSKEILEQNYQKFISYGGSAGIYSASVGIKEIERVTFATIGSIVNTDVFYQFEYLLIDECHLVNPKEGMYKTLISKIPKSKAIGFTATPYRLASNSFGSELRFLTRTRPRVFSTLIYHIDVSHLLNSGYLSKLEYLVFPFDKKDLKLNSSRSEFTEDSIKTSLSNQSFNKKIAQVVQRQIKSGRKKIIVFCNTIENAKCTSSIINNSAVISSLMTKKEREDVISGFKNDLIDVLINVGVLVLGFDYPELDTVVVARPTMSLTLYYQMIGRAIRPHKSKMFSVVVDMCGNFDRFGRVEDLKISIDNEKGKHYVSSGEKQLTNIIFS
jgi:DNA repair protein RadD